MKPRLNLLSIEQVAAWFIRRKDYGHLFGDVKLPKFQRNAVWKPHQVELLWDSIMRGFPVGSFLLAEFDQRRGTKEGKYSESRQDKDPSYHLLDGQQRANAITLGFCDPWKSSKDEQGLDAVLWIDLAEVSPNNEVHREFEFRIVTKSHPWGYRRSNPMKPLGASNYREAVKQFRALSPEWEDWRPGRIPLEFAWPWDADAPLPLSFLIEGLKINTNENDLWLSVRSKIGDLPLASSLKKTVEYLESPSSHPQMNKIAKRFRGLLESDENMRSVMIPALYAPQMGGGGTSLISMEGDSPDPIETLFQRINMLGTPMSTEDLIYALFKSIWPDAHDLIEGLSQKVMPPSRLLMLAIRLVRSKHQEVENGQKEGNVKDTPNFPGVPSVREFRRLLDRNSEFRRVLEDEYLAGQRLKQIFEKANRNMKFSESPTGNFGLPPVLLCSLAQSSPDLYLLLLAWIDRHDEQNEAGILDVETRKTIVGALTVLHWFSKDTKKSARYLWKNIGDKHFWRSGMLRDLVNDGLLYPVLPPDTLDCCIHESFPGGNGWNSWNIGRWQSASLSKFREAIPQSAKNFYGEWPMSKDENQFAVWQSEGWGRICKIFFDTRDFLLYGQRHMLLEWFPSFDPSRSGQLEDHACPWDYDHILPGYYVNGIWEMPLLIKELHGCIGNLRAWPMELNRSDQAETPQLKLEGAKYEEFEARYGLHDQNTRRLASLIDDQNLIHWKKCATPKAEPAFRQFLSNKHLHIDCRCALVDAILGRCLYIYRSWYNNLQVENLLMSSCVPDDGPTL